MQVCVTNGTESLSKVQPGSTVQYDMLPQKCCKKNMNVKVCQKTAQTISFQNETKIIGFQLAGYI